MTVSYNAELSSVKVFGAFWRMLFRWKGSIYKLVLPDMIVYITIYYAFSFPYRYAMSERGRRTFEQVIDYCGEMTNSIPMSFVLGFFVTIVVQRWWKQYLTIPWPDGVAVYVSANIQGSDDRGRLIRRTIMRYINLCFVYMMSKIASSVHRRFPTLDHFVEAGLMTELEKQIFEIWDKKSPHMKYWMPTVWAGSIVVKARKEGRIRDDFAVKTLIDSINQFRGGVGGIIDYDWISVPLVYTQTVTLAVYTFFMAEMMARQFSLKKGEFDMWIPIFSFISFFFYMGWLRVAETLFNPFGDDDDDFEMNWLIDRNLQVSYLIVDEMHEEHPDLVRDQYWEQVIPKELPYTEDSEQYRKDPIVIADEPPRIFQPVEAVLINETVENLATKVPTRSKVEENMTKFTALPTFDDKGLERSRSLFQPSTSRKFAPTRLSLPILSKEGRTSTLSDASEPILVKHEDSMTKRAARSFAKIFTNRLMQNAEMKAEEDWAEAEEQLDEVLERHLPDTEEDGKRSEHEQDSGIAGPPTERLPMSKLDHPLKRKPPRTVAKRMRDFVPDEYTFLLTAVEDADSMMETDSQNSNSIHSSESASEGQIEPIILKPVADESFGDLEPRNDSTQNERRADKFVAAFVDAIDTFVEAVRGPAPPEPPIPPASSVHYRQERPTLASQSLSSRDQADVSSQQQRVTDSSESLNAERVVAGSETISSGSQSKPVIQQQHQMHDNIPAEHMEETGSTVHRIQELSREGSDATLEGMLISSGDVGFVEEMELDGSEGTLSERADSPDSESHHIVPQHSQFHQDQTESQLTRAWSDADIEDSKDMGQTVSREAETSVLLPPQQEASFSSTAPQEFESVSAPQQEASSILQQEAENSASVQRTVISSANLDQDASAPSGQQETSTSSSPELLELGMTGTLTPSLHARRWDPFFGRPHVDESSDTED